MKLLHILKSEPDGRTMTLMAMVSMGQESTEISLYDEDADYSRLVDLIFEHEKVITWW
jgi:hypothetical protein